MSVVLLGSNYYIGLSIIRCLGKKGLDIICMDYSDKTSYGASSKYLKKQIIVPHYTNEDALLNTLIEHSKGQVEKPVLIPSADPYVAFMAHHLEILKEYYLIPMTDARLWLDLMDKDKLRDLCHKHGVLIPISFGADEISIEDIKHKVGYPCLLKPADSPAFVRHFRKKMFVCNNESELEMSLDLAKESGFTMIIQQMILGPDLNVTTYDAYLNQSSKVTHSMTCQKIRQFPINFGASAYTVQKYIPEIELIGQAFLEDVGFKGFAEIEFKKDDRDGLYYLIEVNVRTTTLNVLLDRVGINFPYIMYKDLNHMEVGQYKHNDNSLLAFRYHLEDLLAARAYIKTKQLSISDYFASLKLKKVYAVWDKSDKMPYFRYILQKVLRK